jgi:aldose 1-epimerase
MLTRRTFGVLPDGASVDMISLVQSGGLAIDVLTYGAIIASLAVPDANGTAANVVLGFDRLDSYVDKSPYFGAVVGRYANRIAGARFEIDGRTHHVSPNEPPNHLHGGFKGFDKRLWDAEASKNGSAIVLRRRSPDGEEGYPGTVDVEVTYALADRALRVDYDAVTDAPTHINLSQHSYFNLHGSGDVLSHCLTINASTYLPVDEQLIPTGEFAPVANTAFDFQESMGIGSRLRTAHEQLRRGRGYDHNFNINRSGGIRRVSAAEGLAPSDVEALALAARVLDPASGRTLEIHTTEPGLQFYSGQVVDYRGFCLEPQHYPDSPNRPEFPSALLRPGTRYRSTTIYTFAV